jgi:anti-sigma factor RsiW
MRRPALTTVRPDATQDHDPVASLLAWYVNGTLGPHDTRRVESHLDACADCRADLAMQRSIARTLRESASIGLAPHAGLASVMERIERREVRRRLWTWPLRVLRGDGAARPLMLVAGAQALVIVMLTAVLWVKLSPSSSTASVESFRTLSTPTASVAPDAIRLRLVLADDLSLGELRAALAPWHSRIVAGPEGRGIYTVTIEGDADAALAVLRGTPGIHFAERVVP